MSNADGKPWQHGFTLIEPGKCGTGNPKCGQPAKFYAVGWRCEEHVPRKGNNG